MARRVLEREGSGRPDNDPAETRYGCFLPDLTGLASKPSTAGLPGKLYQVAGEDLQALTDLDLSFDMLRTRSK
jgi:hypothetical protein